MNAHDSSYKHIFSHAEVVSDLLRGFVHEEWVAELDYSSLERVSGSYVTDDLRDRADDIIWRVRSQGSWLYVYLLIEFQSRVDPYMALRILVYTGLLYQDLLKSGALGPSGRLPAVFPVVIYNGEGRWTAPRDVAELIEPCGPSLAAYRPNQRHFVLDEGRLGEQEREQAGNTLADIIQLETSATPEDIRRVLARLTTRMQDSRYDSLRRALVVWINRVVLRRVVTEEVLPELNELQEIDNMLAERVDQWVEQWKQEGWQRGLKEGEQRGRREGQQKGLQEGRQEGRQEGLQKGAGRVLSRVLEKRFGPLPEWAQARLAVASPEQLENWSDGIFEATSLEGLLGSH